MKRLFIVLGFQIFMAGCMTNTQQTKMGAKERSSVIIDDSVKALVYLKVNPISRDSIVVNVSFENENPDTLVVYKPFLPGNNAEDIFSVLSVPGYERLPFTNVKREKYVNPKHEAFEYVVPVVMPEILELIPPHQSKEYTQNIARFYNFEEYLKSGKNSFEMSYAAVVPLIENGKHVERLDEVDSIVKSVYFYFEPGQGDDPDSMRIKFDVPPQ